MNLISKETVSPNADYISSKDDIVYFTVSVYQSRNYTVYVFADSTSQHYGNVSYKAECDHVISKDDIQITGLR